MRRRRLRRYPSQAPCPPTFSGSARPGAEAEGYVAIVGTQSESSKTLIPVKVYLRFPPAHNSSGRRHPSPQTSSGRFLRYLFEGYHHRCEPSLIPPPIVGEQTFIYRTVLCSPPAPAACELYTSDFSQGRKIEAFLYLSPRLSVPKRDRATRTRPKLRASWRPPCP